MTPEDLVGMMAIETVLKSGREPPNGGWDWDLWIAYYKKYDKRFDAAIWFSTVVVKQRQCAECVVIM